MRTRELALLVASLAGCTAAPTPVGQDAGAVPARSTEVPLRDATPAPLPPPGPFDQRLIQVQPLDVQGFMQLGFSETQLPGMNGTDRIVLVPQFGAIQR